MRVYGGRGGVSKDALVGKDVWVKVNCPSLVGPFYDYRTSTAEEYYTFYIRIEYKVPSEYLCKAIDACLIDYDDSAIDFIEYCSDNWIRTADDGIVSLLYRNYNLSDDAFDIVQPAEILSTEEIESILENYRNVDLGYDDDGDW